MKMDVNMEMMMMMMMTMMMKKMVMIMKMFEELSPQRQILFQTLLEFRKNLLEGSQNVSWTF